MSEVGGFATQQFLRFVAQQRAARRADIADRAVGGVGGNHVGGVFDDQSKLLFAGLEGLFGGFAFGDVEDVMHIEIFRQGNPDAFAPSAFVVFDFDLLRQAGFPGVGSQAEGAGFSCPSKVEKQVRPGAAPIFRAISLQLTISRVPFFRIMAAHGTWSSSIWRKLSSLANFSSAVLRSVMSVKVMAKRPGCGLKTRVSSHRLISGIERFLAERES